MDIWFLLLYFIKETLINKLTRKISRLGTTAARLKLKGIGGGFYKWWSMLFNQILR